MATRGGNNNQNLIPFEKGHQGPHVGRPHALSDPEYCQQVAALFVSGATREVMATELEVSEATITRWRKDPRIKAAALPLIEDRIVQITRKVDAAIEARLMNAEKLPTRELLEIRKEFLAGNLRTQAERLDEGTVSEAMAAIEANPQLVDELLALLNKKPTEGRPEDGPISVERE